MRNFSYLFLAVVLCLLVPQKSRATHIIGSEIGYQAVAPGVFVAKYWQYQAVASQIQGANSVTMNLRAPGCSNGFVFTANRQGNKNTLYVNGPPSQGCTNEFVEVLEFTATFALSLSQFSCPEWYLSVQECQVDPGVNYAQHQNACVTVEATLTPMTVNFQVNSPVFFTNSSWVFNLNQPATHSNLAFMHLSPSDSIAYTLKTLGSDHNTPLQYAPSFSAAQPLPSSSGVALHPRTGQLTFTPNSYNSAPLASNRYGVLVEATAFRKINGLVRKISAAQRWLPVYVVNNPGNATPQFINVTANGQPVQANEVVPVRKGQTLTFQFNTADANATDNLMLVIPGPAFPNLPFNTSFNATTGARPSGTGTFNPPASASDQVFYFPVSVIDNACPEHGITTQVYGVKVQSGPTGKAEEVAKVDFTAVPNPFTEVIAFTFSGESKGHQILIYNQLGQQIDQIPVLNSEAKTVWFNAKKHAAGIFMAKLVSENKALQTLKIVKQ